MGTGIEFSSVITYFLLLSILYAAGSIILRYFRFPLKFMLQLLCNSLVGIALMLIVNMFAESSGYGIVINPFNVLFAGVFGVAGVICLFLLGVIL